MIKPVNIRVYSISCNTRSIFYYGNLFSCKALNKVDFQHLVYLLLLLLVYSYFSPLSLDFTILVHICKHLPNIFNSIVPFIQLIKMHLSFRAYRYVLYVKTTHLCYDRYIYLSPLYFQVKHLLL